MSQSSSRAFVRIATTLLAAAAASAASIAKAEVPNYVRILSVAYAGSGCPAGSVANNVSPDYQAFTLLFDQFAAEVGPGVPYNQKRKNCQLNINVDVPAGWSYTVFTIDTRGYATMDPGVQGMQQSSYYFQGQTQNARLRTVVNGPADRSYQARDQIGLETSVWSPCGATRALNINAEVRADNTQNPRGHGLMTVDSIDGQFKLVYGLLWKRCR